MYIFWLSASAEFRFCRISRTLERPGVAGVSISGRAECSKGVASRPPNRVPSVSFVPPEPFNGEIAVSFAPEALSSRKSSRGVHSSEYPALRRRACISAIYWSSLSGSTRNSSRRLGCLRMRADPNRNTAVRSAFTTSSALAQPVNLAQLLNASIKASHDRGSLSVVVRGGVAPCRAAPLRVL
jgi:hypothetical protein